MSATSATSQPQPLQQEHISSELSKMSLTEGGGGGPLDGSDTSSLAEELNHARVDAKETLLALLQFSEGVRVITRHMHSVASSSSSTEDGDAEECKTAEEDDDIATSCSNNPFLSIERMVADTCLKGTVFGTDLLKLWEAAHHIRDFARLVTEESSVSANDVLDAQQAAKKALLRAQKAETLVLSLHRQNQDLRRQLSELSSQKRSLVQEVKSLRQQAATSRKMDMERLLQQHVTGAILLHEEQLKVISASASAAQLQKQQQGKMGPGRRRDDEEEKKEEDDLEMVKAEDYSGGEDEDAGFLNGMKRVLASPRRNKEVSTPPRQNSEDNDVPKTPPRRQTETGILADKENTPVNNQASPTAPSTPSSSYSPIKLFPGVGRLSPPPPPFSTSGAATSVNEKLGLSASSSNKSPARAPSSQPTIEPPPEQPREHVGSKVFNFLFHPEKIAQQRIQEMERQKKQQKEQIEKQLLQQGAASPKAPSSKTIQQQKTTTTTKAEQFQAAMGRRFNALLSLDDGDDKAITTEEKKEDASVDADASVPTLAATTPGSTVASSSVRTAASSPDNKGKGALITYKANDKNANRDQQQKEEAPQTPTNIIPSCVSFSDGSESVQSNLASPKFQQQQSAVGAATEQPPKAVELYQDLKVFRSLAIPSDEDIDDYHHDLSLRHQ